VSSDYSAGWKKWNRIEARFSKQTGKKSRAARQAKMQLAGHPSG